MLSNGVLDPDPLNILPDDKIQHVFPLFGKHHSHDARGTCWCRPEIQYVTEERKFGEHEIIGCIVIHKIQH